MYITDVLRAKGSDVATVAPNSTVTELLTALAERNIGAVVVAEGAQPVGIVSERDVVRRLYERGAGILNWPVSQIMATPIVSCAPGDTVDSLMVTMTERRIRHLPVVDDGRLVGIVSIGDVVKHRVAQLEDDRQQLESYIAQG